MKKSHLILTLLFSGYLIYLFPLQINLLPARDQKYRIKEPDQVLIRLRVDHSGFTTLNQQVRNKTHSQLNPPKS